MAIEKQLNRIELGNHFTRAVAVGNPREFTSGDKEEQEIAEACNRLVKNEFPPPIRLSSPGFSCSAREKSKPRNGAGEIFITAAAEIARETVSATNRFEHETGKPRKFARK
jgi:hypothetical protein